MEIIKMLVPPSKYNIKCPNKLIVKGITVHNTANDASAKNEVKYMITNNSEISFHYAVDDLEIVQGIPEDRNTWSCGDGRGFGNMNTINIEICYSKSGGDRFLNAEKRAAKFIAELLNKYKLPISRVGTHRDRSGKYCPHRTLDMGWDRFLKLIKSHITDLNEIIYIVKAGDTLSHIAQNYKTSVSAIVKYNNIENPNLIQIGQVIRIPQ